MNTIEIQETSDLWFTAYCLANGAQIVKAWKRGSRSFFHLTDIPVDSLTDWTSKTASINIYDFRRFFLQARDAISLAKSQ